MILHTPLLDFHSAVERSTPEYQERAAARYAVEVQRTKQALRDRAAAVRRGRW